MSSNGRVGIIIILMAASLLLAGCSGQATSSAVVVLPAEDDSIPQWPTLDQAAVQTQVARTTPTATPPNTATPAPGTPTATPLPTLTPFPATWQDWPVVPTVSDRVREIYERGQVKGRNGRMFTVLGDSNSLPDVFMSVFDNPERYSLGTEYAYLEPAIKNFLMAFSTTHVTVGSGFTFATMFAGFMADPEVCKPTENPIQCEFRVNNPAFMIIVLGSNHMGVPTSSHEEYLRDILDYAISEGIVPILATKADNMEGDNSINEMIVKVAADYDLPVWNFWRAVQDLPGKGLTEDDFHLSYAHSFFDDPDRMIAAWPWRNLTAMQTLDVVWRKATGQEPAD